MLTLRAGESRESKNQLFSAMNLISINRLSIALSNLTELGLKKLMTLSQAFTVLSLIDEARLSNVIKTIEERKSKVEAVVDDGSFMKNLVGLSNTTATVAGAGGSGGKKGKSETEQMLSKLVGLVDSINRNIEIIAKKETQAATEGTSAPETVK